MVSGGARDRKKSLISARLFVSFALMFLLLASTVSMISMYASGQDSNSTSTEPADSSADQDSTKESSEEQTNSTSSSAGEASQEPSEESGASESSNSTATQPEDQAGTAPESNSTDTSGSGEDQDAATDQSGNSTSSDGSNSDSEGVTSNSTGSDESSNSTSMEGDASSGNVTASQPAVNNTASSTDETSAPTNSTGASSDVPTNSTSDSPPANNTSSEIDEQKSSTNSTTAAGDDEINNSIPLENATIPSNATAPVETTDLLDQNLTSLVKISGEPLLPVGESILRSYSFPILKFRGEVDSEITVQIEWRLDGSVVVEDSRDYKYSLSIPPGKANVTLLQNSTLVAQRIQGIGLSYEIYWRPVMNTDGFVDRYEFFIAGVSEKGDIISLKLDGGKFTDAQDNTFSTLQPYRNSLKEESLPVSNAPLAAGALISESEDIGVSLNSTSQEPNPNDLDGLKLDWSDAVEQGHHVLFNEEESALEFSVNGTFFIDPSVVTTVTVLPSPGKGNYFGDITRMVTVASGTTVRILVFYYDGSNIVYRSSDDEGETWSSATSLGTGVVAQDVQHWNIATTKELESNTYITVFYASVTGSNTNMYSLRGKVDSAMTITWDTPVLMFSVANHSSCGPGACAAFAASEDHEGNLHLAVRYLDSGATTYKYRILRSGDAGSTWTTTLAETSSSSSLRISMALTQLKGDGMLFAYLRYDTANLYYRTLNANTTLWESVQTISSGTGLSSNRFKQISSVTSDDDFAFLAYTNVIDSSNGGALNVAIFKNGMFDTIETADNTLSHFLPNVFFSPNGDININSISNNKIYDTRKSGGVWEPPFNPYGTTFTNPDSLTATSALEDENTGLWIECLSPCSLMIGYLEHGHVTQTSVSQSPDVTGFYEGERRGFVSSDGTIFGFYYDGTHVIYKTSIDLGHTWSSVGTSTGTGQIASDNNRWSVTRSFFDGTERVTLIYYKVSGSNTDFYAKTFVVNGRNLVLNSTDTLFSAANEASCSPTGTCAAGAGSADDLGNLFVTYSYKTSGTWYHRVMKSSDGGQTWTNSIGPSSISSTGARIPNTITKLADGKMLLVFAKYDSSSLFYKVYDGTSWGSTITLSGIGWSSNTVKQISADTAGPLGSNEPNMAYVAFVSAGTSGTLKAAIFYGNGTLKGVETVDSTLSHSLPSITATTSGLLHIFSLSGGGIHDTEKTETGWAAPTAPYGYGIESPDGLTAQIAGTFQTGTFMRGGSSSPYEFMYAGVVGGTIGTTSATRVSPSYNQAYEGEKRIVRTPTALFAFYYDGSNISYRKSTNNGGTWSASTSLGTGKLTMYDYRWTLAMSTVSGTDYLTLFYPVQSGTGGFSTSVIARTYSVSAFGSVLSYVYTKTVATYPNECATCADADTWITAATGMNNYVYAAISYEDQTSDQKYYRIVRSTNAGSSTSWSTIHSATSFGTDQSNDVTMALTKLASNKMLFIWLREDSAVIRSKVYNPSTSTWTNNPNLSGAGLLTSEYKVATAASDSTGKPYLAYIASGTAGDLRIVTWSNSGTGPSIQTVESTVEELAYMMPSITIRPDDTISIYALARSDDDTARNIYKIDKINGYWTGPVKPYDASTVSANQLSVGIGIRGEYAPVMWVEGSNPYTMRESGIKGNTVHITVNCEVFAGLAPPGAPQCLDFGPSPYFEWSSLTPNVRWRQANVFDDCIVYPRAAVDYRLEFPTSFQFESGKTFGFFIGWHHGFAGTGVSWRLIPSPFTSLFGDIANFPETCVPIGTKIVYHNHMYYLNGLSIKEAVFWTELTSGYANPPF